MVDFLETEIMDYDKALEITESRGDTDKIEKLKSNDPEIHNGCFHALPYIFSPEYGLIGKMLSADGGGAAL